MLAWLQLVFAIAIVVAAAALGAAVLRHPSRSLLLAVATVVGLAAAGSWAAFALDPGMSAAIAASGTTASFVVALAAVAMKRILARVTALDSETQRARMAVRAAVDDELQLRTTELERALALARSESISRLAEEERRIAEQRRHSVAEREQEASKTLSASLIEVERRVEQRIAAWAGDLERGEARLAEELERLTTRQRDLVTQAETRLTADAERLEAASEQQRAHVAQLKVDLEKLTTETVAQGRAEIETHAAERRRALHEVGERLRVRERSLQEQIEREEAEALRRIQAGLGEIERRQLDALKRVVDRTATSVAEAAAVQFDGTIRAAREEAARRLGRELERAVDGFLRQADGLLTDQVHQATEAAAKRIEQRADQALAALERQRDVAIETLVKQVEARLIEAHGDLETQVRALAQRMEQLLTRRTIGSGETLGERL
jgi:hypothetical protein